MMTVELLTFLFDRVLLMYLSGVIVLIGLLLGWDTALGRSMARWKLAVAAIFVGSFLATWVAFFTTEPWRWFLRLVLSVTATAVLWQFKRRFGSWRAVHAHACRNLRQWRALVTWHRDGDAGDA